MIRGRTYKKKMIGKPPKLLMHFWKERFFSSGTYKIFNFFC